MEVGEISGAKVGEIGELGEVREVGEMIINEGE